MNSHLTEIPKNPRPQAETFELCVVMPVYNEASEIVKVLDEWLIVLRKNIQRFRFLVLNDGSKDQTLSILKRYAETAPELEVIDKANSGHGPTCTFGYRLAVERGADWVLQIDSDGQCSPLYFQRLWESRKDQKAVFGCRLSRGDGLMRWLVSRIVSFVCLLGARTWLIDANVPYRLIERDLLREVLKEIPENFSLTNILLAIGIKRRTKIRWVRIHFQDRYAGSSTINLKRLFQYGIELIQQLRLRNTKA